MAFFPRSLIFQSLAHILTHIRTAAGDIMPTKREGRIKPRDNNNFYSLCWGSLSSVLLSPSGLSLFSAQSVLSNRGAVIDDLKNLAAQAYQYRIRPTATGGDKGDYSSFAIRLKVRTKENAICAATPSWGTILFTATPLKVHRTPFQLASTVMEDSPAGCTEVISSKPSFAWAV